MRNVQKKMPVPSFWEKMVSRSWWVILFLLLGVIGYNQAIKKKKHEIASLEYRIHEVEKAKKNALAQKEDLLLKLHSENDPDWMELVLMRELGVVPEGFLKVHFSAKKEESSSSCNP
jgi:hypothetical protein